MVQVFVVLLGALGGGAYGLVERRGGAVDSRPAMLMALLLGLRA
jgi:hypothetical protein